MAYEHHIMLNGGGYPGFRFKRDTHYASRLVHVCDVYDALCTHRPYREAWTSEKALAYLEERSGGDFDPAFSLAVRGDDAGPDDRADDDGDTRDCRALICFDR